MKSFLEETPSMIRVYALEKLARVLWESGGVCSFVMSRSRCDGMVGVIDLSSFVSV